MKRVSSYIQIVTVWQFTANISLRITILSDSVTVVIRWSIYYLFFNPTPPSPLVKFMRPHLFDNNLLQYLFQEIRKGNNLLQINRALYSKISHTISQCPWFLPVWIYFEAVLPFVFSSELKFQNISSQVYFVLYNRQFCDQYLTCHITPCISSEHIVASLGVDS